MALTTVPGSGTTLSSSYYMRNFYISNRDAQTASKRKAMDSAELSFADSLALRRAVRELGGSSFTDDDSSNIRSRVLAYIETYNNTLTSTSKSADHSLERSMKQMKSITNEYARELDKIGITVSENGSLKSRPALFGTADISKFEKIFSKDSDYMLRTAACAKKIERQSEALNLTARSQKSQKADSAAAILSLGGNSATGTPTTQATAAAQIVSAAMGTPPQSDNTAGNHINVVL